MTLTVLLILAILAIVTTIISAMGKCPLWIPVLILCIIVLIQQLPIGKTG